MLSNLKRVSMFFEVRTKQILIMTCLLSCFDQAFAFNFESLEWHKIRSHEGIHLFTAEVGDSKIKAIKAQMEVQGLTSTLVKIMNDWANYPLWVDNCKSTSLIENRDGNSRLYIEYDMPFPVKDRNVLVDTKWVVQKESNMTSLISEAVSSDITKNKNQIRIDNANSKWVFSEKNGGTVLVTSYLHVEPNGRLPSWLINYLSLDSPLKTMVALRTLQKN